MKRSRAVSMGAVVVLAAVLVGGCADDPAGPTGDYDEICVDEDGNRVPDERCPDSEGHSHFVYFPYYHGVSNPAHPMGSKVTGGSPIKPSSGGFVRGGFGGMRGATGG